MGATGPTGPKGATGTSGAAGATGATGATGPSVAALAFTAADINMNATSIPDATLTVSGGGTIKAWTMPPPPSTGDLSIDVPVPLNLDPSDSVTVSVHFVTSDAVATGSFVETELDLLDTRAGHLVIGPPTLIETVVSPVTATIFGVQYNEYSANFLVRAGVIGPDDSALISLTRSGAADNYSASVYLTGLTFEYTPS